MQTYTFKFTLFGQHVWYFHGKRNGYTIGRPFQGRKFATDVSGKTNLILTWCLPNSLIWLIFVRKSMRCFSNSSISRYFILLLTLSQIGIRWSLWMTHVKSFSSLQSKIIISKTVCLSIFLLNLTRFANKMIHLAVSMPPIRHCKSRLDLRNTWTVDPVYSRATLCQPLQIGTWTEDGDWVLFTFSFWLLARQDPLNCPFLWNWMDRSPVIEQKNGVYWRWSSDRHREVSSLRSRVRILSRPNNSLPLLVCWETVI